MWLYSGFCILCSEFCIRIVYSVLCIQYSEFWILAFYILYSKFCNLYFSFLYSVFCIRCSDVCILSSVFSILNSGSLYFEFWHSEFCILEFCILALCILYSGILSVRRTATTPGSVSSDLGLPGQNSPCSRGAALKFYYFRFFITIKFVFTMHLTFSFISPGNKIK